MAKEIERKFIVASDAWRANADAGTRISQFYLAGTPERSIRVRIRNDASALLTLKFGRAGPVRDEFEYEIPLDDARQMRAFALGMAIDKTRYNVTHGALVFEVDRFAGRLEGLVIAELETPLEVPDDHLPSWLGRDVTADPAFYNLSLALNGRPEMTA